MRARRMRATWGIDDAGTPAGQGRRLVMRMDPSQPPRLPPEGAALVDPASRAVVVRFLIKPPIAILLASVLNGPLFPQVSALLLLYAIVSMFGAFLLRQRLFERSFTLWDETSWLVCLAFGLQIAT